jgi:hypothetical protein
LALLVMLVSGKDPFALSCGCAVWCICLMVWQLIAG